MITLNIPHASLYIPQNIHFLLPLDEVKKESLLMADLYTDELFEDSLNIDAIKADVSRIVVDTERFTDDRIHRHQDHCLLHIQDILGVPRKKQQNCFYEL